MRNFFGILNLNIEAFGLDISDLALKLVQLRRGGKQIKIQCFKEVALPEGIIKRGTILQPEELTKHIKKIIKQTKGLKTKYVVLSLPEERAFLQVISMPKMSLSETKNAIKYEAENYIPFSADKLYLDCEPVACRDKDSPKDNNPNQEMLLAALPITAVDPYLEALDKAELTPLALETESQSIARALLKDCRCSNPCLIMDIGAVRTTFIIMANNAPRFSASIPLSANMFTESIRKTLKIDIKTAEELKRKCGLKNTTDQEKEVFDALIPILTDLMEQTKKHVEYYHDYATEKKFNIKDFVIKRMIVCGGGGNLIGLDKFLQQEMNMPVEIGNPLVNIYDDPKKSPIPKDQLLNFAVAIGLALRGLKEND